MSSDFETRTRDTVPSASTMTFLKTDPWIFASIAAAAWEAAVCWDDDYAVKRLAEVRAI